MAVHDGLLIAQGQPSERPGVLEVVFLDRRSGELRQRIEAGLPDGLWAAVDARASTRFGTQVSVIGDRPHLRWDHIRTYAKGIAPRAGEATSEAMAGAVRLDPVAGRAEVVDLSALAIVPTYPGSIQGWVDSNHRALAPMPLGSILATVDAADETVVLKRWTSLGEALPDLDLFSGDYVHAIRSADGRHLAVVEHAAPGEWEEYGWSVFALESGERLGELRLRPSHAWFVVQADTLVLVSQPAARRLGDERLTEPLRLRALRLPAGRSTWQRPLRDTSYQGPFVP